MSTGISGTRRGIVLPKPIAVKKLPFPFILANFRNSAHAEAIDAECMYWKDELGYVHFEGLFESVAAGGGSNLVSVGQLDVGFRPQGPLGLNAGFNYFASIPIRSNTGGYATAMMLIYANGLVRVTSNVTIYAGPAGYLGFSIAPYLAATS